MSDTIVVALISGLFTLLGSFSGVMASQKLTQFRLKQLEDKVNRHNGLIERTYKLEGRVTEAEHDIRDIKGRI